MMRGPTIAAVYPDDAPLESTETNDVTTSREGRSTDAARLTFPLQLVMVIIGSILSAAISGWAFSSGIKQSQFDMQSDMRELRTRMEMQLQIDTARNESRTIEIKAQSDSIAELRRLTQLLQLQYQALEASRVKK
jgi:hypothetical protein